MFAATQSIPNIDNFELETFVIPSSQMVSKVYS